MEIDEKADNHGRQAHQRVHHNQERIPPGKPADRYERADRQSDQAGKRGGRQADVKRQADDFEEIAVSREEQRDRQRECFAYILQNFRSIRKNRQETY